MPAEVLNECLKELLGELTHVVIVGLGKDGEITGAASHGIAESNLLLDRGKAKFMTHFSVTGE